MDPNKKFLYFNADGAAVSGPTEVSATTVPVSTSCGMEVTSASNFRMYFKESVETDTLDVFMSRTADSDPREIMESIVNQINYSREPTLVIADNSTGEFADHRLSNVSMTFAEHTKIIFNLPLAPRVHQATAAGAGWNAVNSGAYNNNTGIVGQINGEITTNIYIDLGALGDIVSSSNANDIIGKNDTANAYFTKITNGINGVIYAGELICREEPTTGDPAINVVASDVGTLAEDTEFNASASNQDIIAVGGAQTVGKRTAFTIPSGSLHNRFLYLTHTGTTAGTYDAGKFVIRLFGVPDNHLNDQPGS